MNCSIYQKFHLSSVCKTSLQPWLFYCVSTKIWSNCNLSSYCFLAKCICRCDRLFTNSILQSAAATLSTCLALFLVIVCVMVPSISPSSSLNMRCTRYRLAWSAVCYVQQGRYIVWHMYIFFCVCRPVPMGLEAQCSLSLLWASIAFSAVHVYLANNSYCERHTLMPSSHTWICMLPSVWRHVVRKLYSAGRTSWNGQCTSNGTLKAVDVDPQGSAVDWPYLQVMVI